MKRNFKRLLSFLLAFTFIINLGIISSFAGSDEPDMTDKYDFSEINMITNLSNIDPEGYDDGYDDGGNFYKATAYLARWDGAVSETGDPYPQFGNLYEIVYNEVPSEYHVQDIFYLPQRDGTTANDVEYKKAIMKFGAGYIDYATRNDCADSDKYHNYYLPKTLARKADSFHAVAVVGWDDGYSKNNFKKTPPGDGAFICKNSWGVESCDNGYFYISYYDALFAVNGMAFFTGPESKTNYNKIYQYDPLGVTMTFGFNGGAYCANVFPENGSSLKNDEDLKAVSFYTIEPDVNYEIYVIEDYKDIGMLDYIHSGNLVSSGKSEYAGYHTVEFDSVKLKKGTRFGIVIKLFKGANDKVSIALECPISNHSSKARANSDESFMKTDDFYWADLMDYSDTKNSNCCIKAYTESSSGENIAEVRNFAKKYECSKVYKPEELKAYINPDFFDFKNIKGYKVPTVRVENAFPESTSDVSIPSKYDLRNVDGKCYLSSVKDQKNIGACWAFAAYASLESNILKQTLVLSNDSCVLDKNESIKLKAYYSKLEDIAAEVTWSSSNSSVATVSDDGTVTAVASGKTVVTAKGADGKSAECYITVNPDFKPATSFKLSGDLYLKYKEVKKIKLEFLPTDTSMKFASFKTDNPEVISVRNDGTVTALRRGTATVTATTLDGTELTATCTVNVRYSLWQWFIIIFLLGWLWY